MTNFEKFATGVMFAGLAVTAAADLWQRRGAAPKTKPATTDADATATYVAPLAALDACDNDGDGGGGCD